MDMWCVPSTAAISERRKVIRMTVKTGRPRLDRRVDFYEDFCRVLPRLQAGAINYTQAARELRISVRSLKRYMAQVGYR